MILVYSRTLRIASMQTARSLHFFTNPFDERDALCHINTMVFIYLRVSTNKQLVDNQEHELGKRFPTAQVFAETASSVKERPKLQQLLATVLAGDTVAVSSLDRLGRNLIEILTLIEDLYKRGVNVISLREGVDYCTPSGRLVVQVLMAVAELERNLISQRTKAALAARRAAGVRLGAPLKHSPEMIALAHKLRGEGHTYKEINASTRISVGRLHDMFKASKAA